MKPINHLLLEITGKQANHLQHTLIGQAEILEFAAKVYAEAMHDAIMLVVGDTTGNPARVLEAQAQDMQEEMQYAITMLPHIKKTEG